MVSVGARSPSAPPPRSGSAAKKLASTAVEALYHLLESLRVFNEALRVTSLFFRTHICTGFAVPFALPVTFDLAISGRGDFLYPNGDRARNLMFFNAGANLLTLERKDLLATGMFFSDSRFEVTRLSRTLCCNHSLHSLSPPGCGYCTLQN